MGHVHSGGGRTVLRRRRGGGCGGLRSDNVPGGGLQLAVEVEPRGEMSTASFEDADFFAEAELEDLLNSGKKRGLS